MAIVIAAPAALTSISSRIRSVRIHEDQVYLALALVIGALIGLVIAAFMLISEYVGALMFPPGGSAWRRLVVPVLGSLITGYLLFRYFPGARGSGIPQTKVAMLLEGGYISVRTVIGRFLCSAGALASGIALGREGPSVQIGSGIASVIGRHIGFAPSRIRALIPVGSAAAVSAAFNTPIAGVLFALEEIMGDLNAPVLGSAVLASATSWVMIHLLLGDEPLFHVPPYQLVHPGEFLAYAVLGVAGGLCSVAFVKLTLWIRSRFLALPRSTQWAHPMAGGLVVGVLAIWTPQVLGVGYDYVGQVLNGEITLVFVVSLLCLKLVATAACYGSGNAGGIFGPSLFFGAMLGAAVGSVTHYIMPQYTATPGAYALVGMGALFAGIIRVPMTSVFMIFELTRDYNIVVPLMISNLVSFAISRRLQPVPVYEALALQDGIHLPKLSLAQPESRGFVREFMDSDVSVVPGSTLIAEALADHGVVVSDDGEVPAGAISAAEVRDAIEAGKGSLPISALLTGSGTHVHPDHSLEEALARLQDSGAQAIPVLDRTDATQVRGIITATRAQAAFGFKRPVRK